MVITITHKLPERFEPRPRNINVQRIFQVSTIILLHAAFSVGTEIP